MEQNKTSIKKPLPPAVEAGNKHAEAFCLMRYSDEKAKDGYIEEIWNSRDGVTPFMLRSKDGSRELTHIDWHRDAFLPFYTPPLGARVFVDLTLEMAQASSRRWLTSLLEAAKNRDDHQAKSMLDDIEQECIEEITEKIHHPEVFSEEQLADPLSGYQAFLKRYSEQMLERPGEPAVITVDEVFLKRLAELRDKARGPLFSGPITITALTARALENSINKGFFPTQYVEGKAVVSFVHVPEKLLMIHSEISEALEIFRDPREGNLRGRWKDEKGKPCGFGSELADIIIRTAGLAGALNIDLEQEIREKMEYNANRPYKHGKRYTEQ